MEDILRKIESKQGELTPLYDRMDSDLKLYNLEPFTLYDYDGKTKIERVDNVTLNDPRTFADRVISVISSSKMVIDIKKPNLPDEAISAIKDILNGALEDADTLLAGKRLGGIKSNLTQIAALRGHIGVRVLVYQGEDGNIVYDILPLDTRHCAWEFGRKGVLWVASKTLRSRDAVEDEYEQELGGRKFAKKQLVVTDYYDNNLHVIYVEKDKILEEENTLGRPPVYISPVGTAQALRPPNTTDAVKYEGESIFAADRNVYLDNNKLATIWMTTTAAGFRPPMQLRTEVGQEAPEVPKHALTSPGAVVDVGSSRFEPMPLKDIHASMPALIGWFSACRQRGSFPDVEFGEIVYQLSALAIAKLTEGRNQVFEQVVAALSRCYEFIGNEVKRQILDNKFSLEGREHLNQDYRLEVSFHATSPEENIASYSIARAAEGLVDRDTIRTNILKLRDEGDVEKKLNVEFAEMLVPELRLYRTAVELAKDNREDESKIIMAKLRALGVVPEGKKTPSPKGIPLGVKAEVPLEGTPEETGAKVSQERTQSQAKGGLPPGV